MSKFNEKSIQRSLTPWGMEVKTRLLTNGMKQQELVNKLQKARYMVNKQILSQLLYGIGIKTRFDVIEKINELLCIPFDSN